MKVLVVGSGAREHALAWALSRHATVLTCPGNGGTPANVDVPLARLATYCKAESVDLVVVGPEAPLADGLADRLRQAGVRVFGPGREGARLEASKAHAKAFMARHHIPTARGVVVRSTADAEAALKAWPGPVVVKASGLAAGKGVTLHDEPQAALARTRSLLSGEALGEAGKEVLLEERLEGEEISLLVLVSGDAWKPLPLARDYKRLNDGDQGPNTGGMGAYCPAPLMTPELMERLAKEVMAPIMRGLKEERIDYRGVLYVGLMLTPDGPRVLEFNVRFGDPETQVLMPLLDGSWVDVLNAVVDGTLLSTHLRWHKAATCGVVVASQAYPQAGEHGVHFPDLNGGDEVLVFHAATHREGDGLVSAGGRLFTAVATAPTVPQARERVYRWLSARDLSRFQYRQDIGLLPSSVPT